MQEAFTSPSAIPGAEYSMFPKNLANIIIIFRYSLGDFDFGGIYELGDFGQFVFWITWLIIVLMTCIVFLNFIIAEVSASYDKVQNNL